MLKHSPIHAKRPSWSTDTTTEPCRWAGGFGVNRHNDDVSTITGDGLRWGTDTAELVAAADGVDYGSYLFRTNSGRRYFTVRVNYPLRGDRSDPLDIISIDTATRLYAEITAKSWAVADPFAEAFPSLTLQEA